MRKAGLLLLICSLFAFGAQAAHYSDTYVIPVVGHVQGANGTVWMSDVAIRNISSSTTLTVELIFIESGNNVFDNIFPLISDEVPTGSVTVQPNATVLLQDILDGYDKPNVTGALLLGGSAPFAVTSRAYNSSSPLGQTVEPQRDFFDSALGNLDNSSFAYIPGVIQNNSFRTNVGFVAGSGGASSPMVIEITARDEAGGIAGTRRITIPSGSFSHMQIPLRSFVSGMFEVGSVDFRVVEGEGVVVPYASVIDNGTGEAAFITGVFPESQMNPSAAAKARTDLFRMLLGRVSR